jgi:hypothetical protein
MQFIAVLWLRIRSNRHHFDGSGYLPYKYMPTECKEKYTLSRKFKYNVQNTEIYDDFDTDEKEETMSTGIAVNRSLKIMIFQHVENFGLDPDRHQNGETDPDPDQHQNEKSDQNETPTSLVYRG